MTPIAQAPVFAFNADAFTRARKAKGISQTLLAGLADVGVSTVQRLEAGIGDPQGSTVAAIAHVLEVDMGTLYRQVAA